MTQLINQFLRIAIGIIGIILLFVFAANPIALLIAIVSFFVTDSFFLALAIYFLARFALKKVFFTINANKQLEDSPFFHILFTLLGALAKADGHVSKAEIQTVEHVFLRLKLTSEQKKYAIGLFNQGKASDFIIDDFIHEHFKKIKYSKVRLVLFETLYVTALSDGEISAPEQQLLEKIAIALRVPSYFIDDLNERLRSSGHQQPSLDDCYRLLGIDPSCSQAELKIAYRKLIKENHPDTMLSKGLPKEMIALATEKTAEINKAYHQILKEKYS